MFRSIFLPESSFFEFLVGLVGSRELGVAAKEALAVVVGGEEPTGDVVGVARSDLAGRRVEDVAIRATHDPEQLAQWLDQVVTINSLG